MAQQTDSLKTTPLDALHRARGGKMVGFAGYAMPIQYAAGTLAEHAQCRTQAAVFDVSHMGQAVLPGADALALLERLSPSALAGMAPGQMRYTVLLNPEGGIIDDVIVTAWEDQAAIVLNAARVIEDLAALRAALPANVPVSLLSGQALLALQGPAAAAVLETLVPAAANLRFMTATRLDSADFGPMTVSRCGYTGEDGFEISLAPETATAFAEALLADARVGLAGLGARDTLRLEAGLCLYGNDLDETVSPVEADLGFVLSKGRREAGDFPGAARVRAELRDGPARIRVGIRPDGRAPARAGAAIHDAAGVPIGRLTSGGFGPSLGAPVAMGFVPPAQAAPDTDLQLDIRGTLRPARVVPLPFIPHRYHR